MTPGDDEPWHDTDSAQSPPAVAQGPRFCKRCGARLEFTGATCESCLIAAAPHIEHYFHPQPKNDDAPPISASLWLYGLLLATFIPLFFTGEDDDFSVQNTVQVLDCLIILIFVGVYWRNILPMLRRFNPPWCLAAMGIGFGTFTIASLWLAGVTILLPIEEIEYVRPALEAGFGWAMIMLTTVAQPAIFEELAFRGVILGSMRRLMSDREALIVTAAMFMVLHLAVLSFPHLFLMGLILGWLRLRTGSIWPCIVLHATHNGLVVLYEYWMLT